MLENIGLLGIQLLEKYKENFDERFERRPFIGKLVSACICQVAASLSIRHFLITGYKLFMIFGLGTE